MQNPDTSLRALTSYRLRRASMQVESEFGKVFGAFGLRRTTFSVLAIIVNAPGLRQSDLACALSIERPNLVLIIDELERDGLVNREVAKTDRRAYALQPTKAGKALFAKAMKAARARDDALTQDMTPAQIDLLHQALLAIESNLVSKEVQDALGVSRP